VIVIIEELHQIQQSIRTYQLNLRQHQELLKNQGTAFDLLVYDGGGV